MQLNSVVLPAPFGPISPQMAPQATSKLTFSSAVTPPKRIETPSTARSPASGAPPSLSAVPALGSASSMNLPFPMSLAGFRADSFCAVLTFPAALSSALFELSAKPALGASPKERQNALLVRPVANGEIVVAAGDVEGLSLRHH